MKAKTLLVVMLLLSLLHSQQIIKAESINGGETIYMGKIGIGQAFSILIDPIVHSGGIFNKGGRYDFAYATKLPEGWETKNSSLYGNPLEVVIMPKHAKPGKYTFMIFIIDEGGKEGLPLKWFKVEVEVVESSMEVKTNIKPKAVGVNKPLTVEVEIKNKVDYGNLYSVEIKAKNYYENTTLYIAQHGKQKLSFALSFDKEGEEEIIVEVKEKGNPEGKVIHRWRVIVEQSLNSELESLGEGVLIIPTYQALPYFVGHIIAKIL